MVSAQVNVTVQPAVANLPPTIELLQSDIETTVGANVVLDASRSSDPEGDPLTFLWVQENNSAPSVSLEQANTSTAEFVAPDVSEATLFTFRVDVGDNHNNIEYAQVIVTVQPAAPNLPPTIELAQSDFTVVSGNDVVLDASGSSDPEGDPLTFTWVQESGKVVVFNNVNTAITSFTAPSVALTTQLAFRVEVSDSDNNVVHRRGIHVTVNPNKQSNSSSGGGGAEFWLFICIYFFVRVRECDSGK